MSMSNGTRREQSKSRELLWFLLADQKCFFCKKHLLCDSDLKRLRTMKWGNGQLPALETESLDITEHHKNGNHSDNDRANIVLAHGSCHKSYHAKIVFRGLRRAA